MKPPANPNPLENPAVSLSSPAAWEWLTGNVITDSGELVTDVSALQSIAVYSCVRVIAESVASLPLRLFEHLDAGRKPATDSLLYDILSIEPNPEMSAFTFFETLTGCLALTGNAYAQIVRNQAGQVAALYPLHPLKTEPLRIDGNLVYRTTDGEGSGSRILKASEVLHVPLFCFDGLKGLSPIQQARQAIGLSRAAEKFGARFFGNGSRPGGVLSTEASLDDKQLALARDSWLAAQGGANQGKTAVLPGTWKYEQVGLSPEESQFLETRKFQRTDIAALFRVPPHMIGDTTRLSNSNHEQESLQFVTDTLRPYLCRFEQEIHRKLLPDTGRKANRYFVQFDVRERLRGDFKSQSEGYALGRQWGFYSTNMILEDLGENPIGPVGDVLLYPLNMGNAKALLNPPTATVDPAKSEPAPTPTNADRSITERFTPAYIRLFRDAVGRVSTRNKRDYDSISAAFSPVLESIAAQFEDEARARFALLDTWKSTADKITRDHLKSIVTRSTEWTPEKADEVTGAELSRALRAIHLNIFRDAGAAVALQGTIANA